MRRFVAAAVLAATFAAMAQNTVVKVVPESYTSKAWTIHTSTNVELRVSFWRPDVFRIQAGLKVAGTNETVTTEISATGQYVTTTNLDYTVGYADPLAKPDGDTIILPEVLEDSSRVLFKDSADSYEWTTSALKLVLDKPTCRFSCLRKTGEEVFAEASPIAIAKAATTTDTDKTVQTFTAAKNANYFGGGQQNGSWIHTGKAIDIVADCNWAEGGHPNPAPWMVARVGKGNYYGILRHTFSPGKYDFTGDVAFSHEEARFDAFYFVGESFNQVLDRYTEFTGRPNFIPFWGLELGDADAWMTRDKDTREPKQDANTLAYVETTPDVIARNAEKYRAADMPGGWMLVNDGYGCKYMQLSWTVKALAALGFKTGLWTEGALDRIDWEIGTAGTRVQKIDVAWSAAAYQHGLNCNKTAYDAFIRNSNARPFVWTCQGWAGTQRYAVCWTGDQYGNMDLIRYHVPTVTGSGMSGQAYATTDIDGIFGGSNESYLRDLEWKCFTPAMYVMNGWSNVNKAPWSYPEPYKSAIRKWLKWKNRIAPYMYAYCREAYDTGAPVVRPLAWNFPDDERCYARDGEKRTDYLMMLGRDFLVAPVFDTMEDTEDWYLREIYLPELDGGIWYDYNDGRRVKSGETIRGYKLSLETLPVFVRGGAIIPMYPESLYSSQVPKDLLTLDIWPDGASEFSLYEDDGETRSYREGEFTRQRIAVSAPRGGKSGDIEVSIEPPEGKDFAGRLKERAIELAIHTGARPESVQLAANGKDQGEVLAIAATGTVARAIYSASPQTWYYDPGEKGGTLFVKLAKRPVCESLAVAIDIPAGEAADFIPYAEPPRALVKKAREKANEVAKFVASMNSEDLYQQPGAEYRVELDGTWKRVSGAVVCSKDTDARAVVTFRIATDSGEVIFERVGQQVKDAAQICEVNIPKDAKSLVFTFVNEGEKVPALGIWRKLRLVK